MGHGEVMVEQSGPPKPSLQEHVVSGVDGVAEGVQVGSDEA